MPEITFRVPCIPIAQPRPRAVVFAGRARVFGATNKHPVHAFKATCRQAAWDNYSGPPLEGPVAVSCVFVLPRPQRLIWKRREMPRCPHGCKPDVDNIAKAVLDALSGILWRDDGQIARLEVEKHFAAGDEQPGVMVAVRVIKEEI